MRKILILFVLMLSLVGCGQEVPKKVNKSTTHQTQSPKKVSYVVYTTRTGECYHRAGCASLRQSCYETTKSAAVSNGYRPCKNCVP